MNGLKSLSNNLKFYSASNPAQSQKCLKTVL